MLYPSLKTNEDITSLNLKRDFFSFLTGTRYFLGDHAICWPTGLISTKYKYVHLNVIFINTAFSSGFCPFQYSTEWYVKVYLKLNSTLSSKCVMHIRPNKYHYRSLKVITKTANSFGDKINTKMKHLTEEKWTHGMAKGVWCMAHSGSQLHNLVAAKWVTWSTLGWYNRVTRETI